MTPREDSARYIRGQLVILNRFLGHNLRELGSERATVRAGEQGSRYMLVAAVLQVRNTYVNNCMHVLPSEGEASN